MWPSVTQIYVQELSKHHFWHFQPHKCTERSLNGNNYSELENIQSNVIQASSFIEVLLKKYSLFKTSVTRWFQIKIITFYHYFLTIGNITTRTITDYIKHKNHILQIYIGIYYSFYFRSQLHFCLMHHLSAFKIGRQNIFSTPTLNSWNGKLHVGSLWKGLCTHMLSLQV